MVQSLQPEQRPAATQLRCLHTPLLTQQEPILPSSGPDPQISPLKILDLPFLSMTHLS